MNCPCYSTSERQTPSSCSIQHVPGEAWNCGRPAPVILVTAPAATRVGHLNEVRPIFKLILIALLWNTGEMATASAETALTLDDRPVPYSTWHHMALPADEISFTAPPGVEVFLNDQPLARDGLISAPETPGTYDLDFRSSSGKILYDIALFVLEPSDRIDSEGRINGYRIGDYPERTPAGFIRLEKDEISTKVSPHFTIGQFLCHQQPGHWPKYLLISGPNLDRLEILLAALNEDGLTDADTFFVMSGYRTPDYNTAIGSATLSRHMFGDAADVYLDVAPKDGVMDDINRDGVLDKEDANFLFDYAADLFASTEDTPRGGLGSYSANAVHGPFVHVDGRGQPARWGR